MACFLCCVCCLGLGLGVGVSFVLFTCLLCVVVVIVYRCVELCIGVNWCVLLCYVMI